MSDFTVPLATQSTNADHTLQVDLESSEEDISDIQAEIAVLSSCASPYVTQYKTAFLRGQKLWIVMEYLGGGSCQDLV
jgi:serine/threonine-protein kinase 24/25/MST4